MFKNAGTFSYIRVFGAGHEVYLFFSHHRVRLIQASPQVPAYNFTGLATGQAAAQFFTQAMAGEPLTST